MTSPNFRPEDVKVGSVILFTDNLYRTVTEIQSNPDVAYFDMADRFGLWLDSDFPKTVINGKMGDVSAVSINAPTDTRLTAIEERLTKLEECANDPRGYAMSDMFGNVLKRPKVQHQGEHSGELVHREPQQSPKVCPVSGMFLEEPLCGSWFWKTYSGIQRISYAVNLDRIFFEHGDCFATREDAERYAKHLKAMAKLRRLGGVIPNGMVMKFDSTIEYRNVWAKDMYNQLTPEEQNALMWPNEVK